MTLSWSCNRLELLIVTPTPPAITDPFRRKINSHNIMDWPYPCHKSGIPYTPAHLKQVYPSGK